MKNLFLVFAVAMFSANCFATNEVVKEIGIRNLKISLTEKSKQVQTNSQPSCTAKCGVTVGGVTIATTGGNWFSSCERASMRCQEKLAAML